MKVSVHLVDKHAHNLATNRRAHLVGQALSLAGCNVDVLDRKQLPAEGCDLVVQTGFAPTLVIMNAIARRIPFIIAECPVFRHYPEINYGNWVSWGYNGLAGGAFYPPAPSEALWKPRLLPLKTEGATIIFAQKPNDRSLRGADHATWIREKLAQYPDAEFRPHPLMVTKQPEPVLQALDRCHIALTYNSTAGGEAILRGCVSNPDHWGSYAYNISTSREEWLHQRSWHGFPDAMFVTDRRVGEYILSGYDEALERIRAGLHETPRAKIMVNMHTYLVDDPRVQRTLK